MLLGFLGLYPLLQYLDTPAEILPQSYQYISMIVTCVGVSFAYNLFAGLLRSIGDSLAALRFLIFSAMVNVVLDLYFITQLQLGVQSAGPCHHHFRRAYQRFSAFIISVRVCLSYSLSSSISNGTRPYTPISWSKVWLWA